MKYFAPLAISIFVLGLGPCFAAPAAAQPDPKGKTCRMEQQCHWENYKKICVYVKVCR